MVVVVDAVVGGAVVGGEVVDEATVVVVEVGGAVVDEVVGTGSRIEVARYSLSGRAAPIESPVSVRNSPELSSSCCMAMRPTATNNETVSA